jgi:chromosome segregation ATPase
MNAETESQNHSAIQSDIDELRARFAQTQDLYREACALLFFRYGITPTAAKLYQYVRKGSMSAPAQALAKFWEALRSKARVEIDHPDLPAALKTTAAQAIADIWHQATAAARAEMAAIRIEVQAEIERTRHDQQSAREAADQANANSDALRAQLAIEQIAKTEAQTELEAERRTHVAVTTKLHALQNHLDEAKAQQQTQHQNFRTDLASARVAVDTANERADTAQRRALLEIDQERQARIQVEKQLEALRTQLTQAENKQRDAAHAHEAAQARVQAKLDASQEAQQQLADRSGELSTALQTVQTQLLKSQKEALQYQSEAQTLHALIDKLAPKAPQLDQTGSARKTARKVRSA